MFLLLLVLCICLIVRAIVNMPYESVNLTDYVMLTYEGYDSAGNAIVSFDDGKIDELMTKLKDEYDSAWFHPHEAEDGDYALFRQSLSVSVAGAQLPQSLIASGTEESAEDGISVQNDSAEDGISVQNDSAEDGSGVQNDSAEASGATQNEDRQSADIPAVQSQEALSEVSAGAIDAGKFTSSVYNAAASMGLKNGDTITVICKYDEELAEKLNLEVETVMGDFTVTGLPVVTTISVEDVFSDLSVSFEGISPNLVVSLQNESTNPLVSKMSFEIEEPKEYYCAGDKVKIRALYNDDLCLETGFVVDAQAGECEMEYTAESDCEYITCADDLPTSILNEAIEAGKGAFKDANEYGVRIYCEANLVPVYINKKATFEYGTPNYVSSYFKTVFPEKAGELGLSYNDLDIIYDVRITQADGVSCTAYAAVRFSNIVKNSDGTYTYDFSDPKILSESYFSARVKKNVTESYANTHDVERVYP